MPDSAGRQIDTREELIAALCEAAELEHNLLVQYLFAAMSVRPTPLSATAGSPPGYIEWRAHEVVQRIQSDLYVICREEMAHLGTVSNLLASIGAHPHFMRVPMEDVRSRLMTPPARPGGKPKPIKFSLEPLSLGAIARFRDFELPEREVPPPPPPSRHPPPPKPPARVSRAAPDPLSYGTIGDLYRSIAQGFRVLSNRLGASLFVGAASVQDRWSWGAGLRLQGVTDLRSALAAIDFIVAEGEGSRNGRTAVTAPGNSHLERLTRMEAKLKRLAGVIDLQRHVWPVLSNPGTSATRPRRRVAMLDTGSDPRNARVEFQCAELFNGVYTCALLMLAQFYDPVTETPAQRAALGHATKQVMSAILRPIGEVLVSLPAAGHPGKHAAPPFEIYGHLGVPARTSDRWVLLLERVSNLGDVCRQVHKADAVRCARLAFIAQNLDLLVANLDRMRVLP